MLQTSVLRYGVITLLFLISCSSFKAGEAPDSGFLIHPEILEEDRTRFPFNKVWLKDYSEHYYRKYRTVYIAPVDTSHILKHRWSDDLTLESKQQFQQDLNDLAIYMRKAFIKAIEEDADNKRTVVDQVGPDTMILEMALVELVPTKAWLSTASNILSFFIPGMGAIGGLGSTGSIAIEGRVKDGGTHEVVAMFKDHEKDQITPIGIQDYTWYKHAEDDIDDWAEQFDEILRTKADHQVADSSPFSLRLW